MLRALLGFCVFSLSGCFLSIGQTRPERPPPSKQEQNEILENVRDYVLRNTESISHLKISLVQRRYIASNPGQWQLESVERIPGSFTKLTQYRTALREPFEPATLTSFKWDHWGMLRGNLTYVFSYVVERSGPVPAYSGLIYVGAGQGIVLRITKKIADAPANRRAYEISTILDYPLARVGLGRVVPFKEEEQVLSEGLGTKTITEVQLTPARLKLLNDLGLRSSN